MSVDLDGLSRLHAAATPGPWENDGTDGLVGAAAVNGSCIAEHWTVADAALSAAMCNALPDLLRELRALRAVAEAARTNGLQTMALLDALAALDAGGAA